MALVPTHPLRRRSFRLGLLWRLLTPRRPPPRIDALSDALRRDIGLPPRP